MLRGEETWEETRLPNDRRDAILAHTKNNPLTSPDNMNHPAAMAIPIERLILVDLEADRRAMTSGYLLCGAGIENDDLPLVFRAGWLADLIDAEKV